MYESRGTERVEVEEFFSPAPQDSDRAGDTTWNLVQQRQRCQPSPESDGFLTDSTGVFLYLQRL